MNTGRLHNNGNNISRGLDTPDISTTTQELGDMANHRAAAQFDRAKWRLALLAPLWALQLLLATSMMGLFSWRLGDTVKHYDDREQKGETPTIEFV